MADDLRRFVNRFAISARRAGPVERLKKWAKRNPALATAVVAAVFALGAAGFFAWRAVDAVRQLGEKERQAALEKAMLAAMSGNLDQADEELAVAEKRGHHRAGATRRRAGALYRGDAKQRSANWRGC
jgi:predicted negative regulator of RcsB-dependent stress response